MISLRTLAVLARHGGRARRREADSIGQARWGGIARRVAYVVRVNAFTRWDSTVSEPPVTPPVAAPDTSTSSWDTHKEQETGHFEVKPNESLFFFESISPPSFSSSDDVHPRDATALNLYQ